MTLDSDQTDLMKILAAAFAKAKEPFHLRAGDNVLRLYHAGLESPARGMIVNPVDLNALDRAGLVVITSSSRYGDKSFEITNSGVELARFQRDEFDKAE